MKASCGLKPTNIGFNELDLNGMSCSMHNTVVPELLATWKFAHDTVLNLYTPSLCF